MAPLRRSAAGESDAVDAYMVGFQPAAGEQFLPPVLGSEGTPGPLATVQAAAYLQAAAAAALLPPAAASQALTATAAAVAAPGTAAAPSSPSLAKTAAVPGAANTVVALAGPPLLPATSPAVGGVAPTESLPSPRERARPPRTPRPKAGSLEASQPVDVYEALKLQQPAEVQQQIELEEMFWDARELEERRKDLQQRLKDEEMLERIRRRVAGEKITLPSLPIPKVITKLLTPRGTPPGGGTARTPRSARSNQSQPLSVRSERSALLPPPAGDEGAAAAAAGGETSVAGVASRKGSALSPAAIVASGGSDTRLGSFSGGAPSVARGSKVGPGPRGSRVGKGSAIYTTDARASWFEYYHRPSVAPRVPMWRLRVQQGVETVVRHPDFGLAVTLLIAVNCIALALYQPQLPDTEGRNQVLKVMEMAINFAFTLEVVLVCIAAGGPKEYLRSPWNIFDFTMVLVGYTDFIPSGSNQAGGVRALRALRALRPLRTITRFESLRSIVVCFLEAVPLLISVVQLLVFFTVLAAITGTLLFMDSFHQACFDDMTGTQETNDGGLYDYGCGSRYCPANFTCLAYEPEPPLSSAGFGNVGESMLSTFQVITMSSWAFIMYIVMDNAGTASFVFFLAIVLLQSYFVINLFLAVLKNKFAKAQELYSKVAVEDESKQRSTLSALWRALAERWRRHKERHVEQDNLKMSERSSRPTTGFSTPTTIRAQAEEQRLRRPSLAIPQTRWQWALYYLAQYWFEFRWHVRQVVEHPGFDYAFLACIVANTALLAMTKADMSPGYAATLDQGSRVLTFIFLLEAATKLVGLGPWTYMSDPFNNFDFVIVVLGLVELIISMGSSGTALRSFRTLRILRSLRVLRVLKVFRYLQSLRVITDVLLSSLGAFLAIAGLMTLFIFVFAVIGLQTFGHYDLQPDYPNFHNVWNAIVLVFQTLTLENWGQLMFSVQASAGWASALFFVVWVALGKWTLLTLFLAITLSAFEANYEKYNTRSGSGGGISWLVGWLKGLQQSMARAIRRYRRRRRIAPTSSFNSSSSLTSTDSATGPPPGASKRFKRSLTVMLKETALAALSPATTSSNEGEVPLPTASKRPSQQVQPSKQSFMAGLFTRKQVPSQGDTGLAPDAAAAAAAPGAVAGTAAPGGSEDDGTPDLRLKAHVPGKDAASAAASAAALAAAAQNRLSALSQLELQQKQQQGVAQAGAKAGLLLSPGPPDVLLSLPAGSASDGCEAVSAAAVAVLPRPPTQPPLAAGTPLRSPAELMLNVGTLSDDLEPPQQPQQALGGTAARRAPVATPLGQRGLSPANVVLAMGGGTDDSEVSASPQQLRSAAASPSPPPSHGQQQRPRPRPPQLATAQRPTQRQEAAQQQKEQQRQKAPARAGPVSAMHRPGGQVSPAKAAATAALGAGLMPRTGAEGSPHKALTPHMQQQPGASPPPTAQRVASTEAAAEEAAAAGAAAAAHLHLRGAGTAAAVPTGHVSGLVERFEAFSPTAAQAMSPQPKRTSLVSPPAEARRVLRRVSSAPLAASPPVLVGVGSCLGNVEEAEDVEADDDTDAVSVKSEGDATSLEAAAGDSPSPPKRKRAKSRHARFAGIPDDDDDAAEGGGSFAAAPLLPGDDAGSSSLSPWPSGKAGERRSSIMRALTPHARRQPPPLGALRHSGSSSGLGSSQETSSYDAWEEGLDDSHHGGGSDSDAAGDTRRRLGGSGRFGFGKFGSGRFGSGKFGSGRLGRLGSGGGSFGRHKLTPSDTSAPSDLLDEAAHESEASMGSMHSAGSGMTSGVGSRTGSQVSKLSRLATLGSRLNSSLATKGGKRSKRKDYPQLTGSSLWYFKDDNRLRSAAYYLVTLQNFDYAMMMVVLLSCVQMAMETPNMDPAATRTIILRWIDIGTTVVFWIEALLKIFAFSFHLYIQYFTNKVDFGVVVISTIVLIAESLNARFLKAFRALRAIKPLRVLTRSVSMLLVFHTLTRSLMAMGNVTVLCALCFLIFAILGVQLFAGLLWSCTDPNVAGKADCVGSFIDDTGQLAPREWVNQPYHFDNVGNAFLTLFITATLDGYTPAMYMSMDARAEPGLQPLPGANPAAFLFWFAYITLVAFFVLNLYVGVVFYQFQRLKMLSQTGSAVLTASQTGYVEMMKAVFRLKPLDKAPLPPNLLRRLCHKLAYNYWFDKAMTATIVANILLLATTYYGEPASFAAAKEHANTAFSALVILECLVKLIAMGPKLYWRSSWNKFDLLLTVAALVDLLTQLLNAVLGNVVNLSTIKKTMMLLRTLRMFKLMRKFRGIQSLMTTLIISLPAIVNVGALLLLFFFIYSYMGVLLLGNIKLQQHLNSHANFLNFPNAMLLLFRVATGDDWAGIMSDCMVGPPDCDPHLGECGSKYVWVYFLTFYLAVGLIALNLFTTVILETFERIQDTEAWKITPANLDEFCELWAEFDDGTSLIEPKDLEQILMRLKPPMGLGNKANGTDVVRFVFALDIPLVDGKVPFYRTAFELVKKGAHAEIPQGELKSKLDRMIRRFLNKHGAEVPENDMMSFSVACTVVRIQRHWRGLVAKRKEEAAIEAAKAARRAAGLPSEEDLTVVEEQVEVPQQAAGGSSFRRAMRRASTVLASLRQSMHPSSKQRASTRLGVDGGLAALEARRGSGQVPRPSRAAAATGAGAKGILPFGLPSRLSRASVTAVKGAAGRSLSQFAPPQEPQGQPLLQKQQQAQQQASTHVQAMPGNVEPSQG
ncbi:hypothetical protein N2152v2_006721 [Parachlorella kessleri]